MISPLRKPSLGLLVVLVLGPLASAQPFSEALNPTGDPVGGGPGYSDVWEPAQASVVVATRGELLGALAAAQAGDVVYVDDSAVIDMTGETEVFIPDGVTLASGRGRNGSAGGLITYGSTFTDAELLGLFVTGLDARISGLRMRGPSSGVDDHTYDDLGLAYGIRSLMPGLTVDNCELYAWGKWAIWLYDPDRGHIHHNYLHHNRRDGYGYAIWIGHKGGQEGATTLVEANLFNFNRHSVASSGADNSWVARHNVFLPNSVFYEVDRHDQGTSGGGGRVTELTTNLFLGSYDRHFSLALPIPGGVMRVTDNWFSQPTLRDAGQFAGSNIPADEIDRPDIIIEGNAYGGQGQVLPTARLSASEVEGYAPLRVQFDASASADAAGGAPVRYEWHFGDGDEYGDGLGVDGPRADHVFRRPGVYLVTVRTYDRFGVPGTATQRVTVLPRSGGRWLSAWVRDSYPGPKTGFYEVQVRVDDEVVWRDDVGGDEGWQHVIADISDRTGSSADVEVRLVAIGAVTNEEITSMSVYADDVAVLGGEVSGGDMEDETGWQATQDGISRWGFQWVSGEVRSGERAVRRRVGLRQPTVVGQYSGVIQTVPLGPAIPPGGPDMTEQVIDLREGWNLVALNVLPDDPSIEQVLKSVGDIVTRVEDATGQVYPDGGIQSWDTRQAYLLRASEPVTLKVAGFALDPNAEVFELRQGWNFIPFLGTAPADVATALDALGDALVLVQDQDGRTFAPTYGVSDLTTLTPGQGYRVFLNRDATFAFSQ